MLALRLVCVNLCKTVFKSKHLKPMNLASFHSMNHFRGTGIVSSPWDAVSLQGYPRHMVGSTNFTCSVDTVRRGSAKLLVLVLREIVF